MTEYARKMREIDSAYARNSQLSLRLVILSCLLVVLSMVLK